MEMLWWVEAGVLAPTCLTRLTLVVSLKIVEGDGIGVAVAMVEQPTVSAAARTRGLSMTFPRNSQGQCSSLALVPKPRRSGAHWFRARRLPRRVHDMR